MGCHLVGIGIKMVLVLFLLKLLSTCIENGFYLLGATIVSLSLSLQSLAAVSSLGIPLLLEDGDMGSSRCLPSLRCAGRRRTRT